MKRVAYYMIGIVAAFGLSTAALAQDDLEVTMDVLPPNAAAGAATGEISLPVEADYEGHKNSAVGLDTANRARALKDELDEQFGKDISNDARDLAQERIQNVAPGPR